MKRAGNLIERISETENLYEAWIKAKRGKIHKADILAFERELDSNINKLQKQLQSGSVEIGNYNYFTITDPKKRVICAASFPERVLHHAIMNICNPVFEKHLIYDTYATRKNKGTYAALDRAKVFAKKFKYYIKLDVQKYFDNIEHNILSMQLKRLFKDNRLLHLFSEIIGSYSVTANKGVPIGNLTSQYFANHYLSIADHFAKEILQIKPYIRYMDDILFFGENKVDLKMKYLQFLKFIQNNLGLKLKPLILDKTKNGVPFLGYKIFPYYIKLNQRSKKRFKLKYKIYNEKLTKREWNEDEYIRHILPLLAFAGYADTLSFRKKIIWNI